MKSRFVEVAAAALMVVALVSCGKQAGKATAPLKTVNPATAGTITGTVKFDGQPPVLRPIDMSSAPECVKLNPKPVVPPVVVTGQNGGLANVVVYIKSGLGSYHYTTPPTPVILDQKDCMYVPRVVAFMTGQPLWVENHDPVRHEVHVVPKHNRQWSTSQLPGSPPRKATFEHPEFAMPILCNAHPWMRAYGFIFDNPYFSVTPKDGNFILRNVPPGTYTIEAWQEKYGVQDQTVTIGPRESKFISFTFHAAPAGS